MALHLSGFLANFLSGDDNEAAASADSASFFPFDVIIGAAAAVVGAAPPPEEEVSVPEALFAFSVAITFDRLKALNLQQFRYARYFYASFSWNWKSQRRLSTCF